MSDSLARKERLIAAAHKIAEALRADPDTHQEYAAVAAGILPRSYWRYMDGDSDVEQAFQAIVLPALHEQAKANEAKAASDIGCCESGSGAWANWHKWRLEKKYRKIYGDLEPKRVEVTGKDGGPIVHAVKKLSDEELEAIVNASDDSEDDE